MRNTACNISNARAYNISSPEAVIMYGISTTRNRRAEKAFYKSRPISFELDDDFEEWTKERGIPAFIATAATPSDMDATRKLISVLDD